ITEGIAREIINQTRFQGFKTIFKKMERSLESAHYEIPTKPRTLSVNSSTNLKNIRSVVLGKDGVGKSAFTVRLLTRRFIGEYDSTLEETYRHRVEVDGQNILLEILDTAGQNSVEKIDACTTAGVADVYFVLYSNTDRSSFKEAVLIVKYLVETRNISQASIFLIATKKDLKYQQDVTEYEGRLLAMELGCEFYTISSSEGYEGTQDRGEHFGRRMSFPQDNVGNLSQRKQRNISVSSASSNSIEEESGKIIRAAVLGKDGVGKTAFTVRLLTRRFIGDYDGTLGKL
ncbi:unnamed protein product, partial [Porites evermanni]